MADVKVWHVFGTMDVGGAELRTLELASAMAERGIHFEYVTLSGRSGVLDEQVFSSGSQIHSVRLGPTFPFRFVMALRKHRPEVLDSHVATFSGALMLLAWISRIPVRIAHFRSDGDGHPDTFRRRVQRTTMLWLIGRFATDIIGVSPSSLTHGYRPDWEADDRAQIIPNGLGPPAKEAQVPLRQALGLSSDVVLLMHVGRPSPEKNRPLTVKVLDAVRHTGTDAHLVLVGGQGVDTHAVKSAIEASGVQDYVHDLGTRHDVRSLMCQADALVLTSVREGLPGVVLEALSVGTPVVSTPLPGVAFIAGLVPGIQTVEAADLDGWVASLQRAAKRGRALERDRIRQEFERGPFSLQQSRAAHEAIYRRGTPP